MDESNIKILEFVNEEFDEAYYQENYEDIKRAGVDPKKHYIEYGIRENRNPNKNFSTSWYKKTYMTEESDLPVLEHYLLFGKEKNYCTRAFSEAEIRKECLKNGLFDPSYYLTQNQDVAKSNFDPFKHYMRYGWKELRNPSGYFDIVWYTYNYLGGDFSINPTLHYLYYGSKKNYSTAPNKHPVVSGGDELNPGSVKRICLFAGYDPDGIIDVTVVEYIKELSKFCDVFYMADNPVLEMEFDKIRPYVKGCWGRRYGRYDFGSWSLLAKEYVGWDVIESYDELLLVNDSCYLMRPLSGLFDKMSATSCHWWGMQATKGTIKTFPTQKIERELSLEYIKEKCLSAFETQEYYDFHVGSYFLAFRKTIINNDNFRGILNNVSIDHSKRRTIAKYEIGLTRWLISCGFNFDCFFDKVEPFQPIFTNFAFYMIKEGFPFLKKYLLANNHYNIDGIEFWDVKLREIGISKDLTIYKENLYRTSNYEKIYQFYESFFTDDKTAIQSRNVADLDKKTPKYDNWWVFPVCAFNKNMNDNTRALFEFVKNKPEIKKIILTQSKFVKVSGENIVTVPLKSQEGLFFLLRSRHIFLKHSADSNIYWELDYSLHNLYNLWHGIPLKRIHYVSEDRKNLIAKTEKGNKKLKAVIAASDVDKLAMTAAFWPLTFYDIWLTGLPRHDFILNDEKSLPIDMQEDLIKLRSLLKGRKLVLFAPTFRNSHDSGVYKFSDAEVTAFGEFLSKHNCVLGVREHMADRGNGYSTVLKGENFIDLGESLFKTIEVIYREASVLITDYSSCFIDFLLTERSVISFAFDKDHYLKERGMFYDLDWCFPGDVVADFPSLVNSIEKALSGHIDKKEYHFKRSIFLKYIDNKNSKRVYNKVLDNYNKTHGFPTAIYNKSIKSDIIVVHDDKQSSIVTGKIFSLCDELEELGFSYKIYKLQDIDFKNTLLDCKCLYIFKASILYDLVDSVEYIQGNGGKVILDIDEYDVSYKMMETDSIFLENHNIRKNIRDEFLAISKSLCWSDVVLCNNIETQKLLSNGNNYDVFLKQESTHRKILKKVSHTKSLSSESINIFYIAESPSHSADIKVCLDSIRRLKKEFSNVEVYIFGKISLNPEINADLVKGFHFYDSISYDAMHDMISEMHIHIAPRCESVSNIYKGSWEISQAAVHGIPSIVSPVGGYKEITDGVDGFYANNIDEWYTVTESLIKNSILRKTVGDASSERYKNISDKFPIGNIVKGILKERSK